MLLPCFLPKFSIAASCFHVLAAMASLLTGCSPAFAALALEALPGLYDEVLFAARDRNLDFVEIYSGRGELTNQLGAVICPH